MWPAIKAHNRNTIAEFTVAPRFNQTSSPENGLSSFSGVLFGSFCTNKKNNRKT